MVNHYIQALDDRLGAKQYRRMTRKVSLIEIGTSYYDRCTHILSGMGEAADRTGTPQSTLSRKLRMYASPHISRFFAPIVAEFIGLMPNVSIGLSMNELMINLMEEGIAANPLTIGRHMAHDGSAAWVGRRDQPRPAPRN